MGSLSSLFTQIVLAIMAEQIRIWMTIKKNRPRPIEPKSMLPKSIIKPMKKLEASGQLVVQLQIPKYSST